MKKFLSAKALITAFLISAIMCPSYFAYASGTDSLEAEYVMDYTTADFSSGVYTNDNLNFEYDGLFVRSLKGSSATKDYTVGADENGISAVAGYFLLKKDLGTNYTVNGTFIDDPNGKHPKNQNVVRIYFNTLYMPEKPVNIVYNPPVDLKSGFRFNIKSTSKPDENGNPTEEDLGHTIELQYGEKTIYTDITTDGTRFTVGGETNFSLTYANGGIKLSIINESTGFNYSFEKSSGEISALLEKNGVSAPRTSGCFLIGDHQSMGGRITLKKLDIQNNNITVTDASAPYKGFAVFGNDTQNEISLTLSRHTDNVKKAELYADGEKAADFSCDGYKISAVLPVLETGRHRLKTVITDISDSVSQYESDYFYIGKGTFIADGFTSDDGEISSLDKAYAKSITANFRYEYEKDVTAVICLYDADGNMRSISYSNGENGVAKAQISVPENAVGYSVRAFMCESFENSSPLSGVMELK